mgnify:CR=1 FL=1
MFTTMWYCNKQGGMGPCTLCQEALRLWTWLECQDIFLVVQHLAVSLNARTAFSGVVWSGVAKRSERLIPECGAHEIGRESFRENV